MKISKEKLIKLFKEGISKLHISDGSEMKKTTRTLSDSWSFVLENGTILFGSIELLSVHRKKYYLSFFPSKRSTEGYNNYDYMIKYEVSHNSDEIPKFKHELTKKEFSNLLMLFKRKYAVAKRLVEQEERRVEDEKNEIINKKLEALSDEFELDFFPKKRKVIVEKAVKLRDDE